MRGCARAFRSRNAKPRAPSPQAYTLYARDSEYAPAASAGPFTWVAAEYAALPPAAFEDAFTAGPGLASHRGRALVPSPPTQRAALFGIGTGGPKVLVGTGGHIPEPPPRRGVDNSLSRLR